MYQNKTRKKKSKWRKRQPRQIHRYGAYIKRLEEEKRLDVEATKYWSATVPILENMQKELSALGKPPGYNQIKQSILYCISIFDIISRYQDQLDGGLKIAPGAKSKAADSFNNDLYYAGRHTTTEKRKDSVYGDLPYWNTTVVGEPITVDSICFGPELGLPRKPASYWLALSKKKKVAVSEIQEFAKGSLSKTVELWATEALVKVGINKFIHEAYNSFNSSLEELLK